jgi:hypothetical protein
MAFHAEGQSVRESRGETVDSKNRQTAARYVLGRDRRTRRAYVLNT